MCLQPSANGDQVANRLVALCREGVCLGSHAVNGLRMPSVWLHA